MIFKILFLSSLSFQAFAAGRASGVVQTEIKEGNFSATLKDGFHFNEKAPNALLIGERTIKPAQLSAREAQFNALPADYKTGQATLFVCDDDVTFCEMQTISLSGKALKNGKEKEAYAPKGKTNSHGFIVDDYNQALALAKSKKQLLFIDFSARWCPACVRLEDEIFPAKEFTNITGEFVKLKIDVDRFQNGVVTEKFHIKGIPTLMVVTADQEEVDRILDYQPIEVLGKFVAGVKADPAPLRELMEKAQAKDPEIMRRLGRRLLTAGRANEAVTYLERIKPAPRELLDAKIQASSGDEGVLKAAIKLEPASLRSVGWRSELAGVLKKPGDKKKVKDEGVAVIDDLLAHPEKLKDAALPEEVGEFTGFEPLMLAMSRADLIEAAMGPGPEADAAWKKAAQIGLDMKIPAKAVGLSMRHLVVLNKAKFFEQANALSLKLMKSDPHNPELQRRRLGILVELKKYNEAINLGKKVVKNSYGRNEFWAAQTLAKAFVQADRKKEAREFIGKYLSRNEMEWPNMKDTRKAFEDLKNKIPNG